MYSGYNNNYSKSYTSGFYKNKNENYDNKQMISFDSVEKLKQFPVCVV